jgi:hypothetical protein
MMTAAAAEKGGEMLLFLPSGVAVRYSFGCLGWVNYW